jgi:hypothetical protein
MAKPIAINAADATWPDLVSNMLGNGAMRLRVAMGFNALDASYLLASPRATFVFRVT